MFLDPKIDMIICYRGGYGTMRLLSMIDYEIIKNYPKIFIGYSDITALLNTISSKCNFVTFHGPISKSNFTNEYTFSSFINTLHGGTKPYSITNPPNFDLNFYGESIVSGTLVGGNLTIICSLMGTPYEIDLKDKILFIEDIDEPPYKIDRMLTQLLISGKLNSVKGFILGQFINCDTSVGNNVTILQDVINNRILSLNKPTVTNLQCGHGNTNLTLPIGANIQIDCLNKKLNILESVIS
jgi:muramoyltetrapeptide carboxypeptidase